MGSIDGIVRRLRSLKQHPHPVRLIVSRAMLSGRVSIPFVRVHRPGYSLRLTPSAMTMHFWSEPGCQMDDEQLVSGYLRPGDTFIDIGANIGHVSLAASRAVGPMGRVTAVETHPRIFKYLSRNVRDNDARNVVLVNAAVGSSPGTSFLSNGRSDEQNRVVVRRTGTRVPVMTLDMLDPDSRIDLLKVDVEGYEKFVFEGARRALENTGCIYFEIFSPYCHRFGYEPQELMALLRERGFELLQPAGIRAVSRVPANYAAQRCENLIAVASVSDFCERSGLTLIG